MGQVARILCDRCKQPMITVEEHESRDPIKSYGKGYIGTVKLPDSYCQCPDVTDLGEIMNIYENNLEEK